jgi:phasin family protein
MTTSKSKIVEMTSAAEPVATMAVETVASPLKDGFASATASFEATQAKMKEGVEKAMKTAEELVAFNQANIEAVMKSSQIWVTGVQDLSKHMAAAAQASAFKALTSVKSLKDAFELQSSFARTAMEKSLAESTKLTDASFKLTEQALAPITARVTVAVEKFAKAA